MITKKINYTEKHSNQVFFRTHIYDIFASLLTLNNKIQQGSNNNYNFEVVIYINCTQRQPQQ